MLCKLYAQHYGPLMTVGTGDDLNDLPFLVAVDRPVLVRKMSGLHEEKIEIPGLVRTHGVGPAGWNEAVMKIVSEIP